MGWSAGLANTGHNAGQSSTLGQSLFVAPLSGGTDDYSYLITDIDQVTRPYQLPPSQLSKLSVSSAVCFDQSLVGSLALFLSLVCSTLLCSRWWRESVGVTRLAGVSALTVFSSRPFYLYLCLSVSQSQYAALTPTDRFFSPAL